MWARAKPIVKIVLLAAATFVGLNLLLGWGKKQTGTVGEIAKKIGG